MGLCRTSPRSLLLVRSYWAWLQARLRNLILGGSATLPEVRGSPSFASAASLLKRSVGPEVSLEGAEASACWCGANKTELELLRESAGLRPAMMLLNCANW